MEELKIGQQVEAPVKKKRKRNYVNNPDFLAALKEYKIVCKTAEDDGKRLPSIPRYIGDCIDLMSRRIATRKNFSGYPFVEDMIQDGIETCFRYLDRFNSDKYDNPFAFFSRVIWRAFLQRIAKEKKQLYVKYKNSQNVHLDGGVYESDNHNDYSMSHYTVEVDYMNDYIEDYETKMKEKKEKTQVSKKKKAE